MKQFAHNLRWLIPLLLACGCTNQTRLQVPLAATEGMWLPDAPPVERLKKQFGFVPTQQWLDHLRLASVNIGASGAFISADGLILTNHHVAVGGLQSISRPGKDYVADGFLARTHAEEIRLPGMDASVLESIEDVTARIEAAVDKKLAPDQAVKARQAVIAEIERDSQIRTGYQSKVITLYGGAMYHLYRYKRYNDIRVVFAPEVSSAFFGGDPDNFEYPRYCLDITILRAYENGKPASINHYLRLSQKGAADGELIFVSGHPGRTDRLMTTASLLTMRDLTLPTSIESMERYERMILNYSARGDEQRRQAQENLFSIQNGLKANRPRLVALRGELIQRKLHDENAFRQALRSRPDLKPFDAAWDRIAEAEQARQKLALRRFMLEDGRAFNTDLFFHARNLVRFAAEETKPDAQRLPEYTQARKQETEDWLLADYPIYPEMETAILTTALRFFQEKMGSDPIVQTVLQGKDPAVRAQELVQGTKLGSAEERKKIRGLTPSAIEAYPDAMLQLAQAIDAETRKVRLEFESQVQEPQNQALTEINRARFALMGTNTYPDATGTLRLAFGIVKGYQQDGQAIPPFTTLGGAFDHERAHRATYPFALPKTWTDARGRMDLRTPLNFVSTADITGGNSGSPVVNRAGELVGVLFDSNRQGIADNLGYSDEQARAVSVDSRAILECLSKVYNAKELLAELSR